MLYFCPESVEIIKNSKMGCYSVQLDYNWDECGGGLGGEFFQENLFLCHPCCIYRHIYMNIAYLMRTSLS